MLYQIQTDMMSGTSNFYPYMSSVNPNASWECAMPLSSIDSQRWGPLSSEMAPLHPHNNIQEQDNLDLMRSRGVSMPDYGTICRFDDYTRPIRPLKVVTDSERHVCNQLSSPVASSDNLANRYCTTSWDTNIDNFTRISASSPRPLSPPPLSDHHSSIRYDFLGDFSEPSSTQYRHRSHSDIEIDRLPLPQDRRYLFVNRTMKDGQLISKEVQTSGSWKTIERRKRVARKAEKRIAMAIIDAVSNKENDLRRLLE